MPKRKGEPTPASGDKIHALPLGKVQPDPGQPRKTFDQQALMELAASIRENGLVQPIAVRACRNGASQDASGDVFIIVAGERRYHAHRLLEAPTILARIIDADDPAQIRVLQLIENSQRVDVSPLEEARSYQQLLDETGWSVETLARHLGMQQAWRITERTNLLKLAPEYQALFASGNLGASQAQELSRLSPRGQKVLFGHIKASRCPTYNALRAMANGLVEAEGQREMFEPTRPEPTAEEVKAASAFEQGLERLVVWLNTAIKDNKIEAVHKVKPERVLDTADKIALMRKELERVERALRQAGAQRSLLKAAE